MLIFALGDRQPKNFRSKDEEKQGTGLAR